MGSRRVLCLHLKRYPCLALTASGAGCSSFAKVSPCVTTRVAASVEGQSLSGGWLVVDGVVAITEVHLTLYGGTHSE